MTANLKTIRNMAGEKLFGKKDLGMKASGKRINKKGSEDTTISIRRITKGNLSRVKDMVKEK